jgi:NADH pyrophosphatase NudC (nudix superfamily)
VSGVARPNGCSTLKRVPAGQLSIDWLSQTAKLPNSVFIALHKGHPLVTSLDNVQIHSEHPPPMEFIHLSYSDVKPFLTGENLIFLGTSKSPAELPATEKNIHSKNGRESISPTLDSFAQRNLTAAVNSPSDGAGKGFDTGTDVRNREVNPTTYFCVDLSDICEETVTKLGLGGSQGELLHPYRMLKMASVDRMLYSQAWPVLDWHRRNKYCPTCSTITKMVDGGYKRICQNANCRTHKGMLEFVFVFIASIDFFMAASFNN